MVKDSSDYIPLLGIVTDEDTDGNVPQMPGYRSGGPSTLSAPTAPATPQTQPPQSQPTTSEVVRF